MNPSVHPHHRRHLRPAVRRVLTVTVVACIAVGGASFVLHSRSAVPAASATSTSSASAASEAESSLLTARQAQAILDDPRMVLVNHTNKMPDDHTFTTKACGSATAVNKTLQTEAFRWLSAHAVEYGFILRYPKNAEAVTEITYEPWHWRYVGPENAALIQQSGLCFEDAVAVLQKLAAGEKITG